MADSNTVPVQVEINKAQAIRQMATLSPETLNTIADLMKKPGAEAKFKDLLKNPMVKMLL
jgi:hypothetical protein